MPVVNGVLTDFGLEPFDDWNEVELVFRADQPAMAGGRLLATKDVVVPVDSNGRFETTLQHSNTYPRTTYSATVRWLDGSSQMDIVSGLKVPPEGGTISEILGKSYEPLSVWVGSDAPPNPAIGTWWLDIETDDLLEYEPD